MYLFEINDILRIFFKLDNFNYISCIEDNKLHLEVFKDYFYDNRGGWLTIIWDLNYEHLHEQSEETKKLIQEYLLD